MRRRHLDAPRGIAPLSRSRRPDQTGVSPRPVYPAAARCTWPGVNVASHAHGYRIPSHPSNASRSSAPRGGRNGGNIGRPSQLVKRDSREMTFSSCISVIYSTEKKVGTAACGADFFPHSRERIFSSRRYLLQPPNFSHGACSGLTFVRGGDLVAGDPVPDSSESRRRHFRSEWVFRCLGWRSL